MPNLTLSGVVLGLRSKPYDFTDPTGKQTAGVSHRLFLWDPVATEPIEITVRQDRLGLVQGVLGEGEVVNLNVDVRANGNKVTYVFESRADAAVKPARAAS